MSASRKKDLLKLLADISSQWEMIGLSLNLSSNFLDGLRSRSSSHMSNLSKVLQKWMDSRPSPVTWETILAAIESPIVSNKKKPMKFVNI